jgi:inosine-uridine nucleoside N-ribohydrolase
MKLAFAIVLLLNAATSVSSLDSPTFDVTDPENTKTDVIIFTDCGVEIDDQWMILHLVREQRFNVLAIFSSHCGSYDYLPFPQAESSMREIVELLDVSDNSMVPVFVGSNYPLETRRSVNHETADQIFHLVMDRSSRKRLTIVLSGPATDIASALIKYPEIEDKIRVVATAFQSKQKGMSFNIGNDVAAWQVILNRNVPITVCPGPLAGRLFRISKETVGTVLNTETAVGAYLYSNYLDWIETNTHLVARMTGTEDTWPIWDEVLVTHLLGFTRTEKRPRPKMLANGDLDYTQASTLKPIEWIIDVDTKKTWEHFRTLVR